MISSNETPSTIRRCLRLALMMKSNTAPPQRIWESDAAPCTTTRSPPLSPSVTATE
jgi:hypothetical protein